MIATNNDRNRELVALAGILSRRLLAASLGQSFGGDRDYYDALGYPLEISAEDYLARYERQDIAGRIVDLPALDTWRYPPKISENDATDTPFVQDWESLAKRRRVWSYLSRIDRLSGIGRYGVLLIGMRDGGKPLSEPATRGSLQGPHNVTFLRTLSEASATISQWDWDTNSPRFGMPLAYSIHIDEGQGFHTVHHSRVIHIAENRLDSETYGTPRLQRVYNRLEDLTKIVGGSAEAAWLTVRKGLLITTQPGFEFPTDDSDFDDDFNDEVDEYLHGISRVMRIPGADVRDLGSEVPEPAGIFDVTLSLIAAASGIPKRVLIGSAAGELAAAEEDMRQWYGSVAARQMNYAEPEILRAFIDRMIWLGALPVPPDGYDVGELGPDDQRRWPALAVMSEKDKAIIIESKAQAAQALTDPLTGELPLTEPEQRELLGYPAVASVQVNRQEQVGPVTNAEDALYKYGVGIRQAVRGLWSGDKDIFEAADLMIRTIQDGLRQAWIDGARRAGMEEIELTTRELAELEQITQEEISHVMLFLRDVERNSKERKSPLAPLLTRSLLWLGRPREVLNLAMQRAANDPKLKWVMTAEENCLSCIALSGKVKRASQWEAAGLRPQSPRLECVRSAGGIKVCGCRFDVTDEPLTPGVLPAI